MMNLTVRKSGGSWCYIDNSGVVLKKLQVDEAFNFSEGMAAIRLHKCIGYIDDKFKIVVEPKYGMFCSDFKDGHAVVCEPYSVNLDNPKYGYINKNGKEVIPLIYESANLFYEGVAVVKKGGKWGVINKKGNMIINFKYDMLSNCFDGLFLFAIDHKIGVVDKKGKELALSKNIDEELFHEEIYDLFLDIENINLIEKYDEKNVKYILQTESMEVKLNKI